MNSKYIVNKNKECACKRAHVFPLKEIIVKSGAINYLPKLLKKYGIIKPFIVCDVNTLSVAGQSVLDLFSSKNIAFSSYVFENKNLEPDENTINLALENFDGSCDAVIGVGSGVINDTCKILADKFNKFYIIVATAPSMDGYASSTSSMVVNGLKVSLDSKCADVIVGDLDVLINAPKIMLSAGLGDMLAKYVSLCEWKIANEILGEYYCENIANMVKKSLKSCVKNAKNLLKRKKSAVKSVFEGLIITGLAMAYAGVSRPASGVEHYISHVLDMQGLEFNKKVCLHGVQCAIATLIAIREYHRVITLKPDKEKALKFASEFDYSDWKTRLKNGLKNASVKMIENETKEKKYDLVKHKNRLEIIIDKWDKIVKIINENLPDDKEIENILSDIDLPNNFEKIGVDCDLEFVLKATKDIRDKYVLSRLMWDLGIIDDELFYN